MDSIFFFLNFPTSQLPPFICVFVGGGIRGEKFGSNAPHLCYLFIYLFISWKTL